jgi:hypothetical protein
VLAMSLALASPLSAHREDEYLQATRVAIEPARVQLEIDLTPGVAAASRVFSLIDLDGDGRISDPEERAYARLVLRNVTVYLDGKPCPITVIASRFPSFEEMTTGEGTIRLEATAGLPGLAAGAHRLSYRNAHQPDISVYLVNALIPPTEQLGITGQWRDTDQREFRVDYLLRAASMSATMQWGLTGGACAILLGSAAVRRRRARGGPGREHSCPSS